MHSERQGELFIGLEALLWGLFPVITVVSLHSLTPLVSLAWSSFFSMFFFLFMVALRGSWKDLRDGQAWKDMIWVVLFIGILYYVFYFVGLQHTSPGNASIIALTEILTSYVFFHLWHKHYIPREHMLGAVLMLLGALIVLAPNFSHFQIGDILIVLATVSAPFGNFFQQRARRRIRSESMMFMRCVMSVPLLFVIAWIFGHQSVVLHLRQALPFLLINGFLLLGLSKIFWVEGIHRIGVTKANALAVVSPLITLLAAWIVFKNVPTAWQLMSLVPMVFGVLLLGKIVQKSETATA